MDTWGRWKQSFKYMLGKRTYRHVPSSKWLPLLVSSYLVKRDGEDPLCSRITSCDTKEASIKQNETTSAKFIPVELQVSTKITWTSRNVFLRSFPFSLDQDVQWKTKKVSLRNIERLDPGLRLAQFSHSCSLLSTRTCDVISASEFLDS